MIANGGIERLLATVHAENTTTHIMKRKAYKRAVCAHIQLPTALKEVLIKRTPQEVLLTCVELKMFLEDLHGIDMEVLGCAEPPHGTNAFFEKFLNHQK